MPALSAELLLPIIELISTINSVLQEVFDLVAIPCPLE